MYKLHVQAGVPLSLLMIVYLAWMMALQHSAVVKVLHSHSAAVHCQVHESPTKMQIVFSRVAGTGNCSNKTVQAWYMLHPWMKMTKLNSGYHLRFKRASLTDTVQNKSKLEEKWCLVGTQSNSNDLETRKTESLPCQTTHHHHNPTLWYLAEYCFRLS